MTRRSRRDSSQAVGYKFIRRRGAGASQSANVHIEGSKVTCTRKFPGTYQKSAIVHCLPIQTGWYTGTLVRYQTVQSAAGLDFSKCGLITITSSSSRTAWGEKVRTSDPGRGATSISTSENKFIVWIAHSLTWSVSFFRQTAQESPPQQR